MEIPEIKQHLSILSVLSHYGHSPDRNNMLRCPFHEDRKASMKIYPKTNTAFCFAAGCKTNGKSIDQIDYIMYMDNSTKHEAILKAKEMTGMNGKQIPVPLSSKEIHQNDKKKTTYDPNFDRRNILEKIYQVFKNGLNSATTKKAKEYLKSRNIDFTKIDCGYNSGQFHHQNRLNEADKTACIKAGLLLPYMGKVPHANGQTYTAFAKDCIIFPLLDKQGRIVGLYGRNIYKPSDSKEDGKHYYLKDRKGLYPHYPNLKTRKLIITESIINAATFLQIEEITEEYEVLCCFSTTGLKGEVLQAIKKLEYLEELIFAFDGDKAGRDAAKGYSTELSETMPGVKFSTLNIPDNEDINSLSIGHEKEIFMHLINSRAGLFSLNENLNEKDEIKAFENGPKETPVIEPEEKQGLTTMQTSYLNTKNPDYITYESRNLMFHLMGGINIQQLDRLKVTLKINRTDSNDPLHIIRHTFDMYHTDLLEKFINKTADKLVVSTTDLTKDFALLINMLEHYKLKELDKIKQNKPKKKKLTETEAREALNYLSKPNLKQRTAQDLKDMGIVGEEINSQIYWYAMTSRKCENQVSVICIGSSAMGKSYLQEKVAEGIPEEEKIENTQFSDNCFYYFKRDEIKYMLFLIEDLDGAQGVMFPIREMQTKGKLSKTVTLKDSKGMPRTFTIIVEGPVIFCACTTREKVYEDNANRSLLLYLDTSKEQDKRINDYTKQKRAGLVDKHKEEQIKLKLQNVQRVLQPIEVLNPYAVYIDLPDKVFKPRRTITLLLNFIEAIAFYHQHQPNVIKTATGIEVHPDHIEYAFKLLRDVLFRKSDELSGNCRDFFEELKELLQKENKTSFFVNEIRSHFRVQPRSINRYIKDLRAFGLIKKVGGDKYKRGFEYDVNTFEDAMIIRDEIDTKIAEIMLKIRQEHENRIKNK